MHYELSGKMVIISATWLFIFLVFSALFLNVSDKLHDFGLEKDFTMDPQAKALHSYNGHWTIMRKLTIELKITHPLLRFENLRERFFRARGTFLKKKMKQIY